MNSYDVIETIKCDECGQTIGTGDEYISTVAGEVFCSEDCFVNYYWRTEVAECRVLGKED